MDGFRLMDSAEVEGLKALVYELREIIDASWAGNRPVCDEEVMAIHGKMYYDGLLGNRYVRVDSCPCCGSGRCIARFDFSGEAPLVTKIEADHAESCPFKSWEGE